MSRTRPLRALAYDVVARRDGLAGWKRGRADFRALAAADRAAIGTDIQKRLAALLIHAAATVPYYADAWREIGFVPSATTVPEDLRRLPLLTKAAVREHKRRLVSSAVPRAELVPALTGGTTGTQTEFFRDRHCHALRAGRQWGVLERCGYRPGDRRALLWGVHEDIPTLGSAAAFKRAFRRFASPEEVLCCTVMDREQLLDYHRRLHRFRPRVMYAYPRALEEFARFIRDNRLAPLAFERIICTAETLRSEQRRMFERQFGAEVFNLYCSREHGCVGFECERHDGLHVDTGSIMVEILRDGEPAGPGERGEIVVTDLLNYGMPFIRYTTGDLAISSPEHCACGCTLPKLAGLYGRVTDMLYLPGGVSVAGIMLDDLFIDKPSITHAQFVQDNPGCLDVNVVVDGRRDGLDEAIEAEVRGLIGDAVRIRINYMAEIPRNPRSGKYQQVISRCSPDVALAASTNAAF
jgi:phenylacetate-CoA ligase